MKKLCKQCNNLRLIDSFSKDNSHKDGLRSIYKICCSIRDKVYRDKNRDKLNKNQIKYYIEFPWLRTLYLMKDRCTNKNNKRYKNYGGRGITIKITEKELKKLWFRDKAYLLDKPSIDRKDNDGDYEYGNCGFIEKSVNSGKDKYKEIKQLDLDGNLIRKWPSLKKAANKLNIFEANISHCIKGIRKSTGGFKWSI